MAFYDVFEALCTYRGVTPTQVARENGLTQQTVSHWKTRGSTPKAETVQKLANYFGVTVDYLLKQSNPFAKGSEEFRVYVQETLENFKKTNHEVLGMQDQEPDREYERVCDAMEEADLMIESVGVADPAGPDWDRYYVWHKDAEVPEEDRVVYTFHDLLQVVDQVTRDAEAHKRSYFRKRLDAELF